MAITRMAGWLAIALAGACAATQPAPVDPAEGEPEQLVARRAANVSDDCEPVPGKPPPQPLLKPYTGVAAKARCQREVYTIMGGLTHFLGVKCGYCHEEPDYAKMTHRKSIANWMARELIPSLQRKDGAGDVWCNDCHVVDGKGTARILSNPRNPRFAAEWMTTHLVEEFDSSDESPLRCKDCHKGNLGSSEFQRTIILTDKLPPKPKRRSTPPPPVAPAPTPTPPPAVEPPPPEPSSDAGAPDAAGSQFPASGSR
jgi:hypothetical protein